MPYKLCAEKLTVDMIPSNGAFFAKNFYLIGEEEINHSRGSTDAATVKGTRKMHQVERVNDYVIRLES